MKKVGLTDTVFLEGSRKLRVERVYLRVFPGFLQGNDCEKSRKTLVENVLKSLDIKSWPSEVAMGWVWKNLGISGLKIPGFRNFRICRHKNRK